MHPVATSAFVPGHRGGGRAGVAFAPVEERARTDFPIAPAMELSLQLETASTMPQRRSLSDAARGSITRDDDGPSTVQSGKMRSRGPLLLAIASFSGVFGCRCDRSAPPSTTDDAPMASTDSGANVEVELQLLRNALVAFGNTTPLPVSPEFNEEVPELRPPLERAASVRAGQPIRMRVERDVPFGQVTRLMQAGIGYRIGSWTVWTPGTDGKLRSIDVKTPGPPPRGSCYATAWVGPDDKVQVGLDRSMTVPGDAEAEMVGTIVWPVAGHVGVANVVSVVRRLDARCAEGPFRIYASPTGSFGPAFDLARGMADAEPKPHVSTLQLAVPSLGPLDTPGEVLK
jgi:hypothetical protein